MPVTYNDVPLPFPTMQAVSWIESRLRLSDALESFAAEFPGRYRSSWPQNASFAPDRPIKIGCLRWPPGAAFFATAHFLVDDAALTAIGTVSDTADLVIDDGRGLGNVTTALSMLPPLPLAQRSGTNGLWLLTLVDDRFHWWFRSAQLLVTDATTWADLFTDIGTGLGVTITPDAIDAAYLQPPLELTSRYQFLPLLLDAAATMVGHRVVRMLNGAVVTQTAATALASVNAQKATWPKEAGGVY